MYPVSVKYFIKDKFYKKFEQKCFKSGFQPILNFLFLVYKFDNKISKNPDSNMTMFFFVISHLKYCNV